MSGCNCDNAGLILHWYNLDEHTFTIISCGKNLIFSHGYQADTNFQTPPLHLFKAGFNNYGSHEVLCTHVGSLLVDSDVPWSVKYQPETAVSLKCLDMQGDLNVTAIPSSPGTGRLGSEQEEGVWGAAVGGVCPLSGKFGVKWGVTCSIA